MLPIVRFLLSFLFVAPCVAGCFHFGDAAPPVRSETGTMPTGPLPSACGRLQPFFAKDAKVLTRKELEAGLKVEFAKWDKDGSGDLSASEIEPLNEQLRAQYSAASPVMDWNGDGRVDLTEFGSGWRTMFDLCDTSHDDTVTVRELLYSPNTAPPPPEDPNKPPDGASTPNPNAPP
jgi:hypothetical protein